MGPPLELKRKHRLEFLRCLYDLAHGSERGLVYIDEVGAALHLDETEADSAARYLIEKGLVSVRLQRIISLTRAGVDEVETALEAGELPASPVPVEVISIDSLLHQPPPPPVPAYRDEAFGAAVPAMPMPPMPRHIAPDDTPELAAAEFRQICEALNLDPRELTGDLPPAPPAHLLQFDEISMPMSAEPPPPAERIEVARTEAATATIAAPPSVLPARRVLFRLPYADDLEVIVASIRLHVPEIEMDPMDHAELLAEIDTVRTQLSSPRPKLNIILAALDSMLSIFGASEAGPSAGEPSSSRAGRHASDHVLTMLPALLDLRERLVRDAARPGGA